METVLTKHDKVQTQGRNIRHYANYLTERAKAYRDTKCDFVRGAEHRLEKLSVDKGLLRETEIVQHQISSLLKCDVGYSNLQDYGIMLTYARFWTMSQRTKSRSQYSECSFLTYWPCFT